ncbi:MAG: M91 family zinc metallopeptidase [Clostridiales bacterium]|nr:M91 family zinc metallopeptidase [Clostridiales bacterium]
MNRVLNKLRQSEALNKENKASYIKAVVMMGIFTFVFLGAEYLYVNMISLSVSGSKAVMAQNYALGISALGFLLYPAFCRFCKDKLHTVCTGFITAASVLCIFFICRHLSYDATFAFGLILFLFLGIFGSAVFYKAMCLLENDKYLARLVGISYMIGILLQFANNNIIHSEMIEAVILSAFLIVLVYYLDGNRAKETDNIGKTKEYSYDGAGRLLTEIYDNESGLDSWANMYTYDARGNRISKFTKGGTREEVEASLSGIQPYRVNIEESDFKPYIPEAPLPELTGTADYSVCNYTYDNNNRLTSSSWYDNDYMNRITSYRYDNNGNMTYKHTEQYYDDFAPEDATVIDYPDDTAYYVYNVSNELTRVNRNSVITTYNYDPTGQRISKTVGGATTNDIWDNSGNIVAENDTIYNRGLGGEIISAKGFGDSAAAVGDQYYSYNGHGDTTNLVQQSGTTLAMTGAYEYDAFGNCRTSGSEGSANPFRYNDQYYDEETGLIYLRNRYYDPTTGRFTQEDTYWNVNNMIYGDSNVPSYSAIAQSSNLYVYCMNAPVNGVDPFGLRLVLKGTGDEVQTLWNTIKEFSQDALVLTQEIDDYGRLMDSYVVTVAEERTGGCDMGSILVRRIAYSDVTIDARVWDGDNMYVYETQTIYFNPYSNPDILTINPDDGSGYYGKRPSFIGLAHELIHADRDIRGRRLYGSSGYKYASADRSFWTGKCKIKTDYAPNEELATIGIMYNDWYWDITENDIRAEHGLNLRGAYDV